MPSRTSLAATSRRFSGVLLHGSHEQHAEADADDRDREDQDAGVPGGDAEADGEEERNAAADE